MKPSLAYFCLSLSLPLAATAAKTQLHTDGAIEITLETEPRQVRAGHPFEMTWRVSAEEAHILEAFADVTEAFGPEHKWEHNGKGAFEAKVRHVEETPGPKDYELWAKFRKNGASRFVGESFRINVADPGGDQDLADFLAWLEKKGYSEEIIRIHAHDGAKPLVREEWNRYFKKRKEPMPYRELATMPIVFVDVIATDNDATNEPLDGQMDALENYLERIFGKDFEVQYHQERVAYEDRFGKPTLQTNAKGSKWLKLNSGKQLRYARETAARLIAERHLPSNAVIIRWAAKQWQHEGGSLKIQDLTGSGPANSGADFSGYGLGLYAHEWGHGLGIGHMFVNGPGSYGSRIWGLECIMNHSYVGYANREVGRLLSPLLRYALEPEEGFTDQDTFVAEYNNAMAGTDMLQRRLKETAETATVSSRMVWTTPWRTGAEDSVICEGLKNRSYEIKRLELLPDLQPGSYSLLVGTSGGRLNTPNKLILQRDGKTVATGPLNARSKVSEQTAETITIGNHLSLDIGRSTRGSSNLTGIGPLLHERPLVVPEKP